MPQEREMDSSFFVGSRGWGEEGVKTSRLGGDERWTRGLYHQHPNPPPSLPTLPKSSKLGLLTQGFFLFRVLDFRPAGGGEGCQLAARIARFALALEV